jgi:hypothetical protein
MPRSKEELLATLSKIVDEAIALGRSETMSMLGRMIEDANQFPGNTITIDAGKHSATFVSPQKRGARQRARHGAIKAAVEETINHHPNGIGRADIVKYARDHLGIIIKEGSLKNAIRILKSERTIYNKDAKWFPAHPEQGKPGARTPGRIVDTSD